ncbi:MAG: glycosyltransferase family 2 protein [Candidatus Magasanikbacteria bacterium]
MTFSCIIPFYNEGHRIIKTLRKINQIDEFDEIICIDDGSDDDIYKEVKNKFPKVNLIKLNKNRGKSEAIKTGAREARSEVLFFLDADLKNLNKKDIRQAVLHMKTGNFDMIILKLDKAISPIDIARSHILLAGQRLLYRKDFLEIAKTENFVDFQLEIAINRFMRKREKEVGWMKSQLRTPKKAEKRENYLQAVKEDCTMIKSILSYAGVSEYVKQTIKFAKQEIE